MNTYINRLAKEILKSDPNGISKVKLAKLLYFVHKGLVGHGLFNVSDLKFIRMPLGPVPVGFKELYQDKEINIEKTQSYLSYNTEKYFLKFPVTYFGKTEEDVIGSIVKSLLNIATSDLVEFSHREPSWKKNINGSEYYISEEDLKIVLPSYIKIEQFSSDLDEQRIQARLVEGLLDDIVEESTALEYPEKN